MDSIVIALPKIEDAKKIKAVLVKRGFPVAAVCNRGNHALSAISQLDGGILVMSVKLPDITCEEISEYLPDGFQVLLMGSEAALSQVTQNFLSIKTPLKVADLVNTLEMMLIQISRKKKKEKSRPRQRSEKEKNYIANAKMLLMQRNNLTEEEAFRYIQKNSMDSGTNMVETAQMILMLLLEEA